MVLFNNIIKDEVENILNSHHETFARPIYYFKEREILTLSATNDFNYIYGKEDSSVTKTTQIVSGVFSGRIHWPDPVPKKYSNPTNRDESIPYLPDKTIARLKVDLSGHNIINESKQIRLPDDKIYEIYSAGKPIGAFNIKYFSVLLQAID